MGVTLGNLLAFEWSFRWYGVAALLCLGAMLGIRKLLIRNKIEKEYRAGRIIFRAVIVLLLVLIAIAPLLLFPPYELPPVTGQYQVGTVQHTYVDEGRIETYATSGANRKLNVECWYPENGNGRYPLILFSHGGLGIRSSNESLYFELASHGYVVCSIDHTYHAFWTRGEGGKLTFVNPDYFRELQSEDASANKQQSLAYYQEWMAIRTGDINFVLDTILQQAADGAPAVYGLVDAEKIGVMGHSLGGTAALGIPRQREDIGAVIALESPFLYDIIGVADDEFVFVDQAYPVPVLNIYSDAAWDHLSDWPQYARNYAFLVDPPAAAFSLHLGGAGHFSLTDLALTSPLLVRLLEGKQPAMDSETYLKALNAACLSFFDRYLKE